MVYKQFSIGVIIRVVLLLASLVCIAFIFAKKALFFSQLILLFFLIYQIYDLIRFVNQTNRDLAKFLLAIKHADYSVNFLNGTPVNSSFRKLHDSFDEIIHSYKSVQAQKESQLLYFKLIIEHIQVGIISLSAEKEIVLKNKAAENLLHVPDIQSWVQLQAKQPTFTQNVESLKAGGRRFIEIKDDETRQLSVGVENVLMLGEPFQIITFQDIKNEIEQKEIEAWHKLIRILTHEIMNSVTPVASLTETMLMILEEEGSQKKLSAITEENISDIRFSLKTIQKRSDGMLHFISDYRKLTKIPPPQLEWIKVIGLFEGASRLMQGEINKHQIKLLTHIADKELTIKADPKLIEQVLINMITNSIQALENITHPLIELSGFATHSHTIIEVTDNGKGIDKDKIDKIFIPFYSTKEQGSGIGLSLSKQIMHLHQGMIKVHSHKGIRTSFQLHFHKTR